MNFSCSFINDFFRDYNTIVRKSDGFRWRVQLNFWNIVEIGGGRRILPLNDITLSMFFDDKGNFLHGDYELLDYDYFKDFVKHELESNGKEWLQRLNDEETIKWIVNLS